MHEVVEALQEEGEHLGEHLEVVADLVGLVVIVGEVLLEAADGAVASLAAEVVQEAVASAQGAEGDTRSTRVSLSKHM